MQSLVGLSDFCIKLSCWTGLIFYLYCPLMLTMYFFLWDGLGQVRCHVGCSYSSCDVCLLVGSCDKAASCQWTAGHSRDCKVMQPTEPDDKKELLQNLIRRITIYWIQRDICTYLRKTLNYFKDQHIWPLFRSHWCQYLSWGDLGWVWKLAHMFFI